MAPAARKKILLKWADLIEAHAVELAVLGVRENGTEIGMALKAEPLSAAATVRYYAEAIDKLTGEIAPTDPAFLGLVHREPVGVVGAIVPWNFPLMIGAWKFGPALAAGCTVVLKPAETASLTLVRVAHLALEAGLPPGVLNVVTGEGRCGRGGDRGVDGCGCAGLHRLGSDRAAADGGGGAVEPEAGLSGAGGQVAEHRLCRCARSGRGGEGFGAGDLPQLGAGLHCRVAHSGRTQCPCGFRREAGGAGGGDQGGRSAGQCDSGRGGELGAAAGAEPGVCRRGAGGWAVR